VRTPIETTPDFLTIGHVTRDLLPDGDWRLGGTVYYAAATAQRLGVERVGVLTSGPADVIAALRAALPGVAVVTVPAQRATTFENIYTPTGRRQYLRARAADLDVARLPAVWREAGIVLLAPLNQEVAPALAAAFPGALVGGAIQGWLRAWDEDGLVSPTDFEAAPDILPHLRALLLSEEDIGMALTDSLQTIAARVDPWSRLGPLLVMTRGADGAVLLRAGEEPRAFAGYPADEADPTGAGDVFAAAFLIELAATGDPAQAIDFANRVAALSVRQTGVAAIPTRAEVARAFRARG
jgi:sugar/nucleoside kinase (ribokinase family)